MGKIPQFAIALFACATLLGSAPSLVKLEPRGGQIGKAVKLTLIGSGLTPDAQIIEQIPGAITPLTPSKDEENAGRELPFLVEVSPNAAVGVYPIRVQTRQGLSNVLLFNVGAFPEVEEPESQQVLPSPPAAPEPVYATQTPENDSLETAQAVSVPATINGTLPIADRDYYGFNPQAGQRLVLEVECRRIGSAIDPVIEVFDSSGRRLARNDDASGIGPDARLDLTFPEAGQYFVAVHDSKFSLQQEDFYRLKIGDYSYAGGLFPLGWQRGGDIEVEIYGGSLPEPAKVRPNLAPEDDSVEFVAIPVPGKKGALPLRLALGGGPEALEGADGKARDLTPGAFVNGRIARPGERDLYRVAVRPGENWHFELQKGLGTSSLYGVLTLYDSKGNKLASTSDMGLRNKYSATDAYEEREDHRLVFAVPDGVEEVSIEVEDLLERSGPEFGYRLRAYRRADFALTIRATHVNIPLRGTALVIVTAERKGYAGPIELMIPNSPDDVIVRGGNIPLEDDTLRVSKKAPNGLITLTPKPGAVPRTLNLEVWGEAVIDGTLVRRRARGPGIVVDLDGPTERIVRKQGFSTNVAPWIGADLPAMIVDELPAVLEVMTPHHIRLIQGTKVDLPWVFTSREKAVGPPLPFQRGSLLVALGVRTTAELRQEKDKPSQGTMVLGAQVGWGPGKIDAVILAEAVVEGRKTKFYTPAVTLDVVPAYEIEIPSDLTVIEPGGETQLLAKLKREPGFEFPVEIKPENLPLGVSCEAATVAGDAEEFHLACRAEPNATPGEHEIDLSSSSKVLASEGKEIPFTPPPTRTKLKVPRPRSSRTPSASVGGGG